MHFINYKDFFAYLSAMSDKKMEYLLNNNDLTDKEKLNVALDYISFVSEISLLQLKNEGLQS
jgi:hypothetical protein